MQSFEFNILESLFEGLFRGHPDKALAGPSEVQAKGLVQF
jgi:hypothetical protein